MTHPPSHLPPLAPFRGEVLVAVRARGLVVAHEGGGLLGWRPGLDGPRALADVFAAPHLGPVEHAMSATVGGAPVLLGPVDVLRSDRSTLPMDLEVLAAPTETGVDGWVLRLRTTAATGRTIRADDDRSRVLAERFVSLAEALAAGILIADALGQVDDANPAARELLWRTDAQLAGSGWLDTVHDEDRRTVQAAAERVRRSGTAELVEFRVDVVGRERWIQARFTAVKSATGRPEGWVAVLADVTDQRATNDELSRRATHDPLTGLPNRALLQDRLVQARARVRRSRAPLALLFVDLNGFKPINDDHGHRVGDEVLKEVANRIRQVVRADDTAARLGGDEFVVVAEGVTPDVAGRVAARIGGAIAGPIHVGPKRFEITAAIGVAWAGEAGSDADAVADLLDRADQAMYEAKRRGEPIVFDPDR